MAVDITLDPVTSGYNLSKINSNFTKVDTALQDALSRSGNGPNQMNADLDMNGNDLLNVKDIQLQGSDSLVTLTTRAETAATNAEADSLLTAADRTAVAADKVIVEGYRNDVETDRAEVATNTATVASNTTTVVTLASQVATDAAQVALDKVDVNDNKTLAQTAASNASSAQVAAEAARDATLAAFDSFDDRYLGAKASDPTVDNDGNPLAPGMLYFNTSDNVMKLYAAGIWTAAYVSATGVLMAANNLSDLNNVSSARTNLGLGTAATVNVTSLLQTSNNLSDVANATTARSNLGLGTAATKNTGTSAGNVVELDGSSRLPPVDASQLINLPSTGSSAPSFYKNLKVQVASSTTVTVTADAVVADDGTNQKLFTSINLTKSTSSFSAGTGNGGLDSGSAAAATWYSVWVIGKTDGTKDVLISTSATSPTMPSTYTYKTRVGWLRTASGSAQFMATIQHGNRAQYIVGGTNVSGLPIMGSGASGSISTPTWTSVSTSNYVPSTASSIRLSIGSGNGNIAIVAPNNSYGSAASTTNPPPIGAYNPNASNINSFLGELLLESSNIYWASQGTPSYLACVGWVDNI